MSTINRFLSRPTRDNLMAIPVNKRNAAMKRLTRIYSLKKNRSEELYTQWKKSHIEAIDVIIVALRENNSTVIKRIVDHHNSTNEATLLSSL